MRLHARTKALLGEIAEAERDIVKGRARPRGRLRISALLYFAHVTLGKLAVLSCTEI